MSRDAASASHAVVVGAGIGGLAAAIRLRLQGRTVTVLERRDQVGGRAGLWQSEGFSFDTGPSHLMQLGPLEELFHAAGARLADRLRLERLDPAYRVHFGDGESLTLSPHLGRLCAELERLAPGSSPGALRYLALGGALHRVGMDAVIDRSGIDWRACLEPRHWPLLTSGMLGRRLGAVASRYFADERLRQAFTAQALYMGMDPARAPALYALLPYVELTEGLYFPQGGMHALPRALAALARELGVTVRLGADVAIVEREGDRAVGVRMASGERMAADVVVLNADLPIAYEKLLGEPMPGEWRHRATCGAFVMLLGLKRRTPQLLHHNLYLPRDMAGAMRALFDEGRVPDDPVFYLSNPSRTDPGLAPEGHETLFVLVPVPNAGPGLDWGVEGPALQSRMLSLLDRRVLPGLASDVVVSRTIAPTTWATEWNLSRGAAFGLDHGLTRMGPMRPANRHGRLGNVYFVGASTHPGSGIPLVLLSAKHTTTRVAAEHPVIVQSQSERFA